MTLYLTPFVCSYLASLTAGWRSRHVPVLAGQEALS